MGFNSAFKGLTHYISLSENVFIDGRGLRFLSSPQSLDPSRTHPFSYSVDSGFSFPAITRPQHEADHSIHLAQRLRMSGAMPPLPHMPLSN